MPSVAKVISSFGAGPRSAILMSGIGSNANALLRHREWYHPLTIEILVSDKKSSGADKLAADYGIPVWIAEQEGKCDSLFNNVGSVLRSSGVQVLCYCGFMRIAPAWFVAEFPGINIHPADLELRGVDGLPRYRGISALHDAVAAREAYVRSSVHVVATAVDEGEVLATTRSVAVRASENCLALHQRLKREEHWLYPRLLALLAHGALTADAVPLRERDGEVASAFLRLGDQDGRIHE